MRHLTDFSRSGHMAKQCSRRDRGVVDVLNRSRSIGTARSPLPSGGFRGFTSVRRSAPVGDRSANQPVPTANFLLGRRSREAVANARQPMKRRALKVGCRIATSARRGHWRRQWGSEMGSAESGSHVCALPDAPTVVATDKSGN